MEDSTEAQMWARFHATGDERARAWLIEFHTPLVEAALRTFRGVRKQDVPDLRGAGFVGLIESVDGWDPTRMEWLRFAKFRIRAAMVDGIRGVSWVPKSIRSVARKVELWEDRLAAKLGRMPTTGELAQAMGRTVEETEKLLGTIRGTDWAVASLDMAPEEGGGTWAEAVPDPRASVEEEADLRERVRALASVIERLPPRQADMLVSRYLRGESQKSIAKRHGVHESRVSQCLNQALSLARRLAYEQPVEVC